MEVEMKIRGLMMDPVTNMPIVVLKDPSSDAVLPIWVGIYEANAIALEIEKVATPRPLTHDLIKNVLTVRWVCDRYATRLSNLRGRRCVEVLQAGCHGFRSGL